MSLQANHSAFPRRRTVLRMASAAVLTAVLMLGCSGDDDGAGAGFPVPLPVNCDVPGECLAITATWCVPGNDGIVNCATNNVDLSLVLPGGGTIGIRASFRTRMAASMMGTTRPARPWTVTATASWAPSVRTSPVRRPRARAVVIATATEHPTSTV